MKRIKRKKNDGGFYKNVPQQLIDIYIEHGRSIRSLEKILGVNRYYLYRLLINGMEPTNKTEKGREIRKKLFFADKPKIPKPDYIVKWHHLPKEERHKVIREYLNWKENNK